LIRNNARAALLVAVFALGGCAHYPVNDPLSQPVATSEYRFNDQPSGANTNELFVCLTFSGGGTRAAALSYGVLQKLRDTPITWKGSQKRLLDEIDCISSVSGGSFTAAYYGLFGERVFADFRRDFLETDVQGALLGRALAPTNWVRLASPTFSRIDLAAEYYGDALFEHKTFQALGAGGKRPFVIINATNMANGERFEFTQSDFTVLGSDLSSYPVARAVAASSAFPFLLSPLSLRNYPAPETTKLTRDIHNGLDDFYTDRRRYQWAFNRAGYVDVAKRPYVHLMDGGLADNIGLRPIEAAYRRSSGFIRKLINDGSIEKLLIIVVNARTEGTDTISGSESPPGLLTVASKTATVALDNYSFETIQLFKDLRDERARAQRDIAACQEKLNACPGAPRLPRLANDIDSYFVDIDFFALKDPARRDYFLNLPTSFKLSTDEVAKLIDVGGELLAADPEFRRFLDSIAKP